MSTAEETKEIYPKLSPRLMSTEMVLEFMTEVNRAQADKSPINTPQFVAALELKLAGVIVHSWNQALRAMVLPFGGQQSPMQCVLGAELYDLGTMAARRYEQILDVIEGDEWLFSREVALREKADAPLATMPTQERKLPTLTEALDVVNEKHTAEAAARALGGDKG